ncbi:SGM_3592 family protein [Streptomyces mangrovi]|uniref:SGM_3592 family protein n=1 Tax=Streptomyces mangrovi TaxID=1206892 RepID=UPI00399C9729
MGTGHARRGEGGDGDDARRGAWDDVVLDEDFIRGAEVSEPAARTRMLRARWRDDPPEPQPWRADEPPAGWFWSRGRRKGRRWRRRRKDG